MDYIDIGNIKKSFKKECDEINNNIYQVQPLLNNKIIINNVGKINKITNVLINTFNIEKFECQLISILFSKDDIVQLQNKLIYPLIKIIILLNKEFYANMYYAFLPDISKNIQINKEIDGKFVILLEKNNIFSLYKLLEKYTSYNDMIETLIESTYKYISRI